MSTRTMRKRSRGYTAIEVLMAMTLLAIGGAGVISMQRVTIQGGEDARRYDMANNIANEWISRLQRDSTFWTKPNAEFPQASNLTDTRWLQNVTACAGVFCNIPMPPGAPDGLSPAFDAFGRDLPNGTTDAWYCAQYRLTWIAPPGGPPPAILNLTALMRVEVRVYWNRLGAFPIGNCAAPPPEVLPNPLTVHVVYAATAIRPTAKR